MKKGVVRGRAGKNSGPLGSEQGFQEKLLSNVSACWFILFGRPLT